MLNEKEEINGKLWSGHGTLDVEDMKALMTLNNLKRFATKEEMEKIKDYFYELTKWRAEEEQEVCEVCGSKDLPCHTGDPPVNIAEFKDDQD